MPSGGARAALVGIPPPASSSPSPWPSGQLTCHTGAVRSRVKQGRPSHLSSPGRGREAAGELQSGGGLGDVLRSGPVFLEELPPLVRSARLEDAGAAVRGVGQTLRIPGKLLLHLGEDLTFETVLLDQGHVPADYAILVLALGSGRKRLEGFVEDTRTAEGAAADHHRLTDRFRHPAARSNH